MINTFPSGRSAAHITNLLCRKQLLKIRLFLFATNDDDLTAVVITQKQAYAFFNDTSARWQTVKHLIVTKAGSASTSRCYYDCTIFHIFSILFVSFVFFIVTQKYV